MKLLIEKKTSLVDKKAFETIKAQVKQKPDSLIGLAVGKTTDGLYKLISRDVLKSPIQWKKVKLFQIDENLGTSPDSLISFNHEVRQELNPLLKLVNPKNVFLIDGTKNPKLIIKEAYKFIKKNKGIDLIILGLGPIYDPHIAYNTTGKSSLNSKMRVVDLHPKITKKLKSKSLSLSVTAKYLKGITVGIKDILESKKALLIAYGKDKARSVSLTLNGKVNMSKASASALVLHKDLTVILDKAASKYLITT